MKKYIFILIILINLISCSNKTNLKSKFHIKEITNIASNYVYNKYGEKIEYKDAIIYKKGYGKWYITFYGDLFLYNLELDEDANILIDKKEKYKE